VTLHDLRAEHGDAIASLSNAGCLLTVLGKRSMGRRGEAEGDEQHRLAHGVSKEVVRV